MSRKYLLTFIIICSCSTPDQLHTIGNKGTITTRGADPRAPDAASIFDAGVNDASQQDVTTTTDASIDANPCLSEDDTTMCSRLARQCGATAALDNCNQPRVIASCGSCQDTVCNFTSGLCCSSETDAAFCLRLGKECGAVQDQIDNCSVLRTVSCGTCASNSICNTNKCQLLPIAASPTTAPPEGTFTIAQSVTLSSTTPGAKIYYTIDGSAPTATSALFSTPILVNQSLTIKSIAVAPNFQNSIITISVYTIVIGVP